MPNEHAAPLFQLPGFVFFDPEQRRKTLPMLVDLPDGSSVVRVPLSRGFFAVLDVADWEGVHPHYGAWFANIDTNGLVYARARLRGRTDLPQVTLHRAVMEAGDGERVFFRNHETLDCRRANLLLLPSGRHLWTHDASGSPQESRG